MTITIAEQPVLVDVNGEAQAWLDRFMPESEIFRPPMVDLEQYLSGQKSLWNGSFFRSSLPALPPITIGQIQWPCVGACRYARGLFLVDRSALFAILNVAWGQAIPTTYPYPIPSTWSQTRNRTVTVFLAEGVDSGPPLELYLHCLLPIRVSDDLWILPLVDSRYFRLPDVRPNFEVNPQAPTATWQDLFDGYSNTSGSWSYYVEYADEGLAALGNPDSVFREPNVPNVFAIDAACFSVGCRPVVPYPTAAEVNYDFPKLGTLHVECQLPSVAAAHKSAMLELSKITGGTSGASRKPRLLKVATRLSREYFSGMNEAFTYSRNLSGSRNGVDLYSRAVWNTIDDETAFLGGSYNYTKIAFQAYVDAIASKLNLWHVEEHYVVFPDLIYLHPSGFDDYIIYESSGDKKTTTVRSLPIDFAPPFLLGQARSGPDFDGPYDQTKWFYTNNQTCVAIVTEEIPKATIDELGFRGGERGKARIRDRALVIGGVLSRAEVYVVATDTCQEVDVGSTIHIVWVDDYYLNGVQTHWIVDWAEEECSNSSSSTSLSNSSSGSPSSGSPSSGSPSSGSPGSSSGPFEPPFPDCECNTSPGNGTDSELDGAVYTYGCNRGNAERTPCNVGVCQYVWVCLDPEVSPGPGSFVTLISDCNRPSL